MLKINQKHNPEFTKVITNFDQSIYYQIYKDAFRMWSDNKLSGVGLNNFEKACKENLRYKLKKLTTVIAVLIRTIHTYNF